ncbi:DUF1275 family protein [Kitasatospora sp. NPDC094015]|uniref:DUF1275 family protein n=1 Tax=Kitasatospora sp. NPDC094015 TaxID=3155205 RepID=UPI00332A0121
MTRALLVLAAGAANAFGFLALGGVFTSVVTANSAVLGLSLGTAHLGAARLAGLALLGYLLGAVTGSAVTAGRGRLPARGLPGGLAVEALALWLVTAGWLAWDAHPDAGRRAALLLLTAAAMGCQNGSVRVAAGTGVTTSFLTGAVTSAVAALVTRGRGAARDSGVVLLFIAGAAAGGATFRWLHPVAPLLPTLLVTVAFATARGRARQAVTDTGG